MYFTARGHTWTCACGVRVRVIVVYNIFETSIFLERPREVGRGPIALAGPGGRPWSRGVVSHHTRSHGAAAVLSARAQMVRVPHVRVRPVYGFTHYSHTIHCKAVHASPLAVNESD